MATLKYKRNFGFDFLYLRFKILLFPGQNTKGCRMFSHVTERLNVSAGLTGWSALTENSQLICEDFIDKNKLLGQKEYKTRV